MHKLYFTWEWLKLNLSRKGKFLLHASTVFLSNCTALHLNGCFRIQARGSKLKTGDLTFKPAKIRSQYLEVFGWNARAQISFLFPPLVSFSSMVFFHLINMFYVFGLLSLSSLSVSGDFLLLFYCPQFSHICLPCPFNITVSETWTVSADVEI